MRPAQSCPGRSRSRGRGCPGGTSWYGRRAGKDGGPGYDEIYPGAVDGDILDGLDAVIEVTGTKRYKLASGGTSTVPLVEPFKWDVTWKPKKKK